MNITDYEYYDFWIRVMNITDYEFYDFWIRVMNTIYYELLKFRSYESVDILNTLMNLNYFWEFWSFTILIIRYEDYSLGAREMNY